MRGLTYAIGEIALFMMAATLVGYLLARFRQAPQLKLDPEVEEDVLKGLLVEAESRADELEQRLADANAVVEGLVATNDELTRRNAALTEIELAMPAGPNATEGGGDERDDNERDDAGRHPDVAELLDEIARQEEMIARLERIATEADALAGELAARDARIADLEAALTESGEEVPPELAYSFIGSGSGIFADSRIDFEILD